MFNNNSDVEMTGEDLAKVIFALCGCHPVLAIHEVLLVDDGPGSGPPHLLRDYSVTIDTALLGKVGEFNLSYVDNMIETAITNYLRHGSQRQRLNASRKYSFSDTPEWWDDAKLVGSGWGRTWIHLDVALG